MQLQQPKFGPPTALLSQTD